MLTTTSAKRRPRSGATVLIQNTDFVMQHAPRDSRRWDTDRTLLPRKRAMTSSSTPIILFFRYTGTFRDTRRLFSRNSGNANPLSRLWQEPRDTLDNDKISVSGSEMFAPVRVHSKLNREFAWKLRQSRNRAIDKKDRVCTREKKCLKSKKIFK